MPKSESESCRRPSRMPTRMRTAVSIRRRCHPLNTYLLEVCAAVVLLVAVNIAIDCLVSRLLCGGRFGRGGRGRLKSKIDACRHADWGRSRGGRRTRARGRSSGCRGGRNGRRSSGHSRAATNRGQFSVVITRSLRLTSTSQRLESLQGQRSRCSTRQPLRS